MLSTGTPWEQEPEYIAACRTELQPGEQTTYSEFSEFFDAGDPS